MNTIELCGQTLDLDNLQSGYFNIDCMIGMKAFPDKYFDLAVVDPPYGGGGGEFRNNDGTRFGERFDRYKQPSEESGGQTWNRFGGWFDRYKQSAEQVENGRQSSGKKS